MPDGVGYHALVDRAGAYLEVELDLTKPVEIGDFAALFAGFGSEFNRYLREEYPDLPGRAQMYVREVREGSIIADLIANIDDLIGLADKALIILTFGSLFSKRLRDWATGVVRKGASRTQLRDALRALANDNAGTMTLRGFRWKQSTWVQEFEAVFDSRRSAGRDKNY